MLNSLFHPKSIAVIGASATPGKLGFDILANLVESNFKGVIYPVNPHAEEILGCQAYQSVTKIRDKIDLAIIAVPANYVVDILRECAEKDIKNVVIITAGFKETGTKGLILEEQIVKIIQKNNINLVGPNCLGIINPHIYMNASFAEGMPKQGKIALISQSGAMAVAITDWAYEMGVGFSKIVSLGNKAGINENSCLEYLAKDSKTEVIMMYLESFIDGREFMRLATKIAKNKVIIVFKAGSSQAGAGAVASHTGALSGSDVAVKTALAQCGVIRASTIEDFFDYARVFSMQPLPIGNRIAVVTNAGGPGVICTDFIDKSGLLKMAEFSDKTKKELQDNLPPTANIHNPVDIVGDALAERYQKALSPVFQDDRVDTVVIILTPQIMTQKESTVRIIVRFNKKYPKKTIICAFMGGKNVEYYGNKLAENEIPNFLFPTRGLRSLEVMERLRLWREKISAISTDHKKQVIDPKIKAEINHLLNNDKKTVSQKTVIKLLNAYKIAVPEVFLAKTENEAVKLSEKCGYPIVLKIVSKQILHKTDAGGVRLALKNSSEVIKAYREIMANVHKNKPDAVIEGVMVQKMYHMGREVIIGMKRDPVFGSMIMFGLGGIYVEILKDVSFRIAPVSHEEALLMIDEIKAILLLKGVRGEAPSDLLKVAETIVKVSQMALDFPQIKELDINPLMVFGQDEGVSALDVRLII